MRRYGSTQQMQRWDGKKVYATTLYPIVQPQDSDVIVITSQADYLDSLAYKYYGDPTLWWIIAVVNNLGKARMSVPAGLQLRIPSTVNQILVQFNTLNQQTTAPSVTNQQ
jgi:phage tail protein X